MSSLAADAPPRVPHFPPGVAPAADAQRAAPTLSPTSALYRGHVSHARFEPVTHRFRYGMFMTALNLDDVAAPGGLGLGRLLDPSQPLSLMRLRRRDHLGAVAMPLKDAVLQRVREELPDFVAGPVLLLTHLAQFGLRFNPVNFYFCFAPGGERIAAIVLEVNNTPWGEQHCYVLDCRGAAQPYKFVQSKAFMVSPFLPLDMEYRFRFEFGADTVTIHKENWRGANRVFHAALTLRRQPLTRGNVVRALLQYPLMTWKVVSTIYFEALRLWLKGVPFLGHQGPREDARHEDGRREDGRREDGRREDGPRDSAHVRNTAAPTEGLARQAMDGNTGNEHGDASSGSDRRPKEQALPGVPER